MGRVVGVKGGRRRPGLDEAHDITTIEVSSRTNGLRFFLYALLPSLLLRRGKLNHRGWKSYPKNASSSIVTCTDAFQWCLLIFSLDSSLCFCRSFKLSKHFIAMGGKLNEWCTKWNAHPGLFCHALSDQCLLVNTINHFIWRFVKTKIFTLCAMFTKRAKIHCL